MKALFYILLATLLFPSCDKCRSFNALQHYAPYYFNYDFENVISIDNLQGTYTLNDTVWFTIEIPKNFSDKNKPQLNCTINDDELPIHVPSIFLISATDTIEYSNTSSFAVFFKLGNYNVNKKMLNLEKFQDMYKCTFGIVLNDLNYTSIRWTLEDKVRIESIQNTSQYCGANPKCPNLRTGFVFKTKIADIDDTKFSFTVVP